jgi:hypothetical protein
MMKTLMITAALAGLTAGAAPSLAMAQNACEAQKHDNKVAGTIFGAIGGALLGGAISHHGAGGPLLGAAGGAVVGNQLARSNRPCPPDDTGYYDSNGYYHGGYYRGGYDRNGYYHSGYDRNGYYRSGYGQDGYYRSGYAYPTYGPWYFDRSQYRWCHTVTQVSYERDGDRTARTDVVCR